MALSGFYGILYYGILASLTGGYLPVRAKNLWLTLFHLALFIGFLVSPLIVFFVSVCAGLITQPLLHNHHTTTHAVVLPFIMM